MHESVRSDPIAYVLSHAFAAATANQEDPHALVADLCASRLYADAMVIAIAIEVSKAKQREAEGFWCKEMDLINHLGIDKTVVLDELGKRTLFWFLATHRNDWRDMKIQATPLKDEPCPTTSLEQSPPPPPPPRRKT
jgi:hypothetical protein